MGPVLRGKGRFRRLLPGHFAPSSAHLVGRSCWCSLGWGLPMPWWGGRSWGTELRGQVRADWALQAVSLVVFLCCIWIGKRWFYCLLIFFFFIFPTDVILKHYFTVINDWQGTVFRSRSRFALLRLLGNIGTYHFWFISPTVLFRISYLPSYKKQVFVNSLFFAPLFQATLHFAALIDSASQLK